MRPQSREMQWDQMHFDLFKFTINESTVLCLLIVKAESAEQLTSVLRIWSLAVTAVLRQQEGRDVNKKKEGAGAKMVRREGRGGDDEATAE